MLLFWTIPILYPITKPAAEETTTAPVSIKFRKPEVKPNADEDAYTPEVSPDYDFREIMDGSLSNAVSYFLVRSVVDLKPAQGHWIEFKVESFPVSKVRMSCS